MADYKRSKAQSQLTPEEILARGFRARCRFRAAIRFVIRNMYWLDDVEEQELGEDVQKNVVLLTRKKEKESLLSLRDKSILNKPLQYRTEEEMRHLHRVIGNLKCFKKFQNEVKSKLAGVTFFYYYGPGRVVVRQGDPAYALYFILTGEVVLSQNIYDPIFEQKVEKPLCTMGPGLMFGEVALLHNITRESTITTSTHCELLCLKRRDFEVVLKATVQHQWDEIHNALNKFTYFQDWDDILVRECCVLAKQRSFARDQIILGDGCGLRSFVYFIIKGKCRVIEHLLVSTSTVGGRKQYQLYIPPKGEELSIDAKSDSQSFHMDMQSEIDLKPSADHKSKMFSASKTLYHGGLHEAHPISELHIGSKSKIKIVGPHKSDYKQSATGVHSSTFKSKSASSKFNTKSEDLIEQLTRTPTVINLSSNLAPPISHISFSENIETHFMQVCYLNETGCFAIGENLAHRRVVAVVPTQCLLIPRNWLMLRHAGNIWLRIQQFLNNHIPSTKQVFKEFLNQRKWLKHRKQLVNDILSKRRTNTNNTPSNIPYFIRINEEIDTE